MCGISQYVIFLSNRRGMLKLLGLQGDSPPQFPHLVGHPDLSMRKTLRVVGLLTVMILFQSKIFKACKIKVYNCLYFDGVPSTEDYPSILK